MNTGELLNKTWVQMTLVTCLIAALVFYAIRSHDNAETTVNEQAETEEQKVLCLAVGDDDTIKQVEC